MRRDRREIEIEKERESEGRKTGGRDKERVRGL